VFATAIQRTEIIHWRSRVRCRKYWYFSVYKWSSGTCFEITQVFAFIIYSIWMWERKHCLNSVYMIGIL